MDEKKEHRRHRKHRNVLYGLVMILIVSQIIFFVMLNYQITGLNSQVELTKENLTSQFNAALEKYDEQNQRNFNDISKVLVSQNKNFQQQITLLKSSQGDFSGVIEKTVQSVVAVSADNGLGTGFILTGDGFIVTNEHVINGSKDIKIMTYSKDVMNAKLIGFDVNRDIALLKINGNYNSLNLANSDDLQVGRKVIAIGNPLGLSFTVTEGIISALNREGPNGLKEYIQTDVSLNPGNSGGPLIDTEGNVIGINNFKIGGAENIGFALESNSIKKIVNLLSNNTII